MLEELWTNLKPQTRRAHGRITKEWGEIGFQGWPYTFAILLPLA